MKTPHLVHWSNWASQPSVQVACIKAAFYPDITSGLPEGIYRITDDKKHIFYAFDRSKVTCENCRDEMVDTWHTKDGGEETLHEYMGMTLEEYKAWVKP